MAYLIVGAIALTLLVGYCVVVGYFATHGEPVNWPTEPR